MCKKVFLVLLTLCFLDSIKADSIESNFLESSLASNKENIESNSTNNQKNIESSPLYIADIADSNQIAESNTADSTKADSKDSKDSKEQSSKTNKNYTLQNVVATGSALESDVTQIPGNLSIVDSKSITTMPNAKISDIVKKLAGVRVDNDVSFNPRPKIRIRGINYGTLLMLDGVILSDLEGEARILNSISLYDVERVEVARGSYASLYGTGAIGGVINFITSMPQKLEYKIIAGYGNTLVENNGDKNIFRFYGSIGNVFFDKRLKLKLSFGYTHGDYEAGFPTYFASGDTTAQNQTGLSGYYTDKAGQTIIGTGGYRSTNNYDLRLKGSYDIGESGTLSSSITFSSYSYKFTNYTSFLRQNGIATDLINGKNYFIGSGLGGIGTYSHLLGHIDYTHNFEDSILKIALSSVNLFSIWQDADVTNNATLSGGAGKTQDTDSTSNYLDIIYSNNTFEKHKITAGTQFRYYRTTQEQRNMTNWLDNATRTNSFRGFSSDAFVASVFINVDSTWLDSQTSGVLSTNAGLRYDFWRNFNGRFYNDFAVAQNVENQSNNISIFSPKIGLNYSPYISNTQNLTFKISLGTGFRMPTMRDKYTFRYGNSFWDINSNLKHESALSFDIGTEYRLDSKILGGVLNFSAYYFQIELSDMIYRQGAGSAANPWKYVNVGKGRVLGSEIAFEIPLVLKGLNLQGNYTLTSARVLENAARPATIGKQLAATPLHSFNLALNYSHDFGAVDSMESRSLREASLSSYEASNIESKSQSRHTESTKDSRLTESLGKASPHRHAESLGKAPSRHAELERSESEASITESNSQNADSKTLQNLDSKENANLDSKLPSKKSYTKGTLYASLWAFYVPAFFNDDINSPPLKNTYSYYEDQFALNLKIGYKFDFGLDTNLTIYNMTNYRYYDFYQVPATSAYLQLGYSF